MTLKNYREFARASFLGRWLRSLGDAPAIPHWADYLRDCARRQS